MQETIEALNRDTIARSNGVDTSPEAMNSFFALVLENRNCDKKSYRNRLEWISCYDKLNEELKKKVATEIQQMDVSLSQEKLQVVEESTFGGRTL